MKQLICKLWFKLSVGLIFSFLAVTLASASYSRIWSWRDYQVYQAMSRECHPVWRELHSGRIHAGQNVEDVIAATKPVQVERFGEFVSLNYQEGFCFTGVTISARNGRLIGAGAWSCTWRVVFFNATTGDNLVEFCGAKEAHLKSIEGKRAEEAPAADDEGK